MLEQKSASPPAQSMLICRLRHKQLQRGASPTAGEIELENCSPDVLQINTDRHPLQFLDLVVTDPCGRVLSQGYYGDVFSPQGKIDTFRLAPGAKYQHVVSLLETLPRDKRVAGQYRVQAVYEYNGFKVVSEPLVVQVPAGEI